MAVNQSTLFNEFLQDYPDWIEIYNPGPNELDLGGWYLTDQKSELHLWQFPPSVILGAEEYQIVFASGLSDDQERPPGELHTSFRLGRNGEYLGWCVRTAPRWSRNTSRITRRKLRMYLSA